jgi:dihydroorotase
VTGPVLLRGVLPYGEGPPTDLLLRDGVIAERGSGLGAAAATGAQVRDCGGLIALPGFVDLHTHLREPGGEDAETIATGSAAAALGGYTAVFAMANTDPVADNVVVVEHVRRRGREVGLIDVHPVGAVTAGLGGTKLAEMAAMARSAARVRLFSDDGHCVADPLLMRRALEYSTGLAGGAAVIAQHAEDPRLTAGAQAHEGAVAARLGLPGWPAAAEETIVVRDALLAGAAGARLHICHVSSAGTVDLLRWAKQRGIRVTAEVTPHHLMLDHGRIRGYDPIFKVNPPLRDTADVAALRGALVDGVIDCVATDHAPHASQHKDCEWSAARPGMMGLQTALSVVVATLVEPGLLDWRGVARVLAERPAVVVGLAGPGPYAQGRPIAVGEPANLTLVDPAARWTVHGTDLAGPSANTPYDGMRLPARVVGTVLRGRITAWDGTVHPRTAGRLRTVEQPRAGESRPGAPSAAGDGTSAGPDPSASEGSPA